ncbi:MAG: hypothetical protein CM1200mP24_07140 [Gammaproteobacteria bacterium]|nr:MAG: hypothetical protein CM1200mP24_07140 [Gammaproteobacteria bacterium]
MILRDRGNLFWLSQAPVNKKTQVPADFKGIHGERMNEIVMWDWAKPMGDVTMLLHVGIRKCVKLKSVKF